MPSPEPDLAPSHLGRLAFAPQGLAAAFLSVIGLTLGAATAVGLIGAAIGGAPGLAWATPAALAAGLATGWAAARWMGRRITTPLEALARGAQGFAEGDLETPIRARGGYEVALLAKTLDGARVEVASRIARQCEVEARLEAALEEARAASRVKAEFLATMSHEIRTPMNGVIGMTELLLDSRLNEVQREYAEIIHGSGESLLRLINDILDFSRIEAGRLELEVVEFNPGALVEETLHLLAPRAQAKGVTLSCDMAPGLPRLAAGDPARVRQVLLNLIGNAIKFTQRGQVAVRVMRVDDPRQMAPGPEHLLFVEVQDTGIGVPAELHERLFDAFTQADGSTTRRFGGSGLGLAICRGLVEQMGGAIGVESEAGRGSRFWFTVRLESRTEEPAEAPRLAGLRALVVDAEPEGRLRLRRLMRSWGVVCEEVGAGPEAVSALVAARDAGDPFDVAILDQHLPGQDGLAVAQTIRRIGRLRDLTLVLTSTWAARGLAEQAEAAGVQKTLARPLKREQLHATLISLLVEPWSIERPAGQVEAEPPAAAPERGRLLVAEDNPVNQRVITHMLDALGYDCEVVADGHAAVEAAEGGAFIAVLMDCQMPGLDGLGASAELRRRGCTLPIIALTANAMEGDRERCLAAGMSDYLSKPLRREVLAEALERWSGDEQGLEATG